ncbi:hypothetical protein [Lederbergia lenta]|uniref:hypothetical protein n=1 Tax=Lederbergia lenta TaxID=1467 RepID=UPI00203B7D4E|nr:hypothetical protein [Lederbergia lenta]MCM3109936.1 hypothetical protein [Lederbergia lenta]
MRIGDELILLYLYQSDIYYLEQKSDSTIVIYTNDGREIRLEAKSTDYEHGGIIKITEKELD